MPRPLQCPTCGKVVLIEAPLAEAFPFCSGRCRDRDFGAWIDGRHAIAGDNIPIDDPYGDVDSFYL